MSTDEPGSSSGVATGDQQRQVGVHAMLKWLRFLIAALLCCAAACAVLVAIGCFPVTEGWFEALIFLEKHGLQPYRDIQFVLPPMVIIYFHLLTAVTHGDFVGNKLLGICVSLADATLLFLWLRRATSTTAAALTGMLAFVLITTVPSYVASDYHDLDQGFLTITLMLLLSARLYDPKRLSWQLLALALAAGASAQLLFMTKQNIGLMVAAAYLVYLCARTGLEILTSRYRSTRQTLVLLAAFITGFVVTAPLVLFIAGVSQPYLSFIHYLLTINSKGSPLYIATRIFYDTNNFTLIAPAASLAIFVVLAVLVIQHISQVLRSEQTPLAPLIERIPKTYRRYLLVVGWVTLTLVLLFVIRQGLGAVSSLDTTWLWDLGPGVLALTGYFLDVSFTVWASLGGPGLGRVSKGGPADYARILLFGSVIYSNTLTASLNVVGLVVLFAFYAAYVLDYALRYVLRQRLAWGRLIAFGFSLALVVFVGRLELSKLDAPYSWWGMTEPPVYAGDTWPSQVPLRGFLLDKDRVGMLSSIVREIQDNTNPADPILAYPDIPVFYYLADRLPMTRSYVQWFDFSTTDTLIPDFRRVAATPPKVIVQLSLPLAVYQGHETLLGHELPQKDFSDYLSCVVTKGAFQITKRYFYNQTSGLEGVYRLRSDHALSASQISEIAVATRNFGSGDALVTDAIGPGNSDVTMAQMQMIPDQTAPSFDGVVIQGISEEMPALVRYLSSESGSHFNNSDYDNFVLSVLLRQPDWQRAGAPCRAVLMQELDYFKTSL